MNSLGVIVALGFFLGMRHATDPDHVIAVSTIVTRYRSPRHAALIGMAWGFGHTLTILLPPEPLALRGDFARVAQILANLINNAAKYTERGGRISVTAQREDSEIAHGVAPGPWGRPCLVSRPLA